MSTPGVDSRYRVLEDYRDAWVVEHTGTGRVFYVRYRGRWICSCTYYRIKGTCPHIQCVKALLLQHERINTPESESRITPEERCMQSA